MLPHFCSPNSSGLLHTLRQSSPPTGRTPWYQHQVRVDVSMTLPSYSKPKICLFCAGTPSWYLRPPSCSWGSPSHRSHWMSQTQAWERNTLGFIYSQLLFLYMSSVASNRLFHFCGPVSSFRDRDDNNSYFIELL